MMAMVISILVLLSLYPKGNKSRKKLILKYKPNNSSAMRIFGHFILSLWQRNIVSVEFDINTAFFYLLQQISSIS